MTYLSGARGAEGAQLSLPARQLIESSFLKQQSVIMGSENVQCRHEDPNCEQMSQLFQSIIIYSPMSLIFLLSSSIRFSTFKSLIFEKKNNCIYHYKHDTIDNMYVWGRGEGGGGQRILMRQNVFVLLLQTCVQCEYHHVLCACKCLKYSL